MIDKSIRQHYQDGEEVNTLTKLKNELMAIPRKKITPTSIAKNVVTRGIGKKLAGTGLLSSLGPIGALLAMFLSRKGMDFASKKWGEGGVGQALASGFAGLGVGSPQEGKELRVLEKRRANMLQRKEEGKTYSDKNLGMVTRAIAEAKGIDINNPNEMKNIDKDISNLYSKTITSQVIPKTPEIISPHLLGGDEIITPPKISPISYEDDFAKTTIEDIINKKVSPISYEDDFATTTIEDIITPPAWNPGIAAQEAAEKQATFDRAVAENKAKAAAEAAAARVWTPPVRHHTGGGGNGGNQGNQASADAAGGSSYSSPFAHGGRIDKPFTGRNRDI